MAFDLNRFQGANLAPRECVVSVPDLAHFFGEGDKPEWTVRGLSGEEIARSNENASRHTLIASSIQALANASAAKSDVTEAVQSLLGFGTDVPEDLAKRIDHLLYGSVSPKIDRAAAVRLFAFFPIVAYTLTNKILELTGQGPDLGK